MAALIGDFVDQPLSEEDRLSALAGAIATVATTRYSEHRGVFMAALRSWALEISITLDPEPPRATLDPEAGPIAEAQDLLLGGIDIILRSMLATGMAKHHRLVTELAIMARLLGSYDAGSVHLVLTAAARACDDPVWRKGGAVPVSLCESGMPLSRDAHIAALAPRGTA
ncbi:MAG TPA: hypothetical protein VGL83_00290 [Stellaceae bacterium]